MVYMARSYRDLLVWQKAKKLALDVYKSTESFPKSETYGMTSQVRRAAVSVVSNIAEGQGRLNKGEFRQFLGLSRGSLLELDTQLLLATELGYLEGRVSQALDGQIYQVLGLLDRLIASLVVSTLKP
jgi:four helix bundle protein